MQTFSELRTYIIDRLTEIEGVDFLAKDRKTKEQYTAVYLFEKPEAHELISGNGVIIKFREINGGHTVRQFAVELRILSNTILNLIKIRDWLVNTLDFFDRPCQIDRYKKFVLGNDSGAYFDKTNNMYIERLTFDCKLL